MSLFGRALAGAGGAAANLAQQYINAEMEQQKAQALADIQFANAKRTTEWSDEFQNDPARLQRNRDNKALDVKAGAKAARDAEVEGLTDETYQGAKTTAADRAARDETRRKIDAMRELTPAEIERINQITPVEVERARLMEEARARTSAKYRDQPPSVQKKLAEIEAVLGRPLTEQEKLSALGMVKNTRDPELDTETVTEEKINPDGSVTKVQRKQVRRPGAAPAAPQITLEQAHQQAQEAIAKGASREAVNARLKEAGFAPLPGGDKPATPQRAPLSPEQQQARRIANMDDATFAAYQKMQSGEPTTPQERQLLRRAGVIQ